MAMSPKYAEVKYDEKTGRIEGLSNLGLGGEPTCKFVGKLQLFAIDLAMMLEGNLGAFMKLADGYGAPGFFPSGYDWSGIRDSSDLAKGKMFVLAVLTLDSHFDKLAAIGIPAELAAAMTEL